jgi:hypothetical protein
MEELDRLIHAYRLQASSPVASKLDMLMDFVRIRDPGLVPFLLTVMRDRHEPEQVRILVLKELRNGHRLVVAENRAVVAEALGDLIADHSAPDLRLQATLALGEFAQIDGVLARLSAVCLAEEESIDLRYAAFTSLERAGPTPECVALLRQLSNNETLGPSSRSVLSAWHIQ